MTAPLTFEYWPSSVLVEPSEPVREFGPSVLALGQQLIKIQTVLRGKGLAAPQIGVLKQVFVMEFTNRNVDPAEPAIICNPVIEEESPDSVFAVEGCLSMPGVYQHVVRPNEIVLNYQTPFGEQRQMVLSGEEARVAYHETDHLGGIMFFDPKRMNRQLRKSVHAMWQKRSADEIRRSEALLAQGLQS